MAAKEKSKERTNIFKGMFKELKKVTWPTKKQLIIYSIVVLVTVIVFSLIIGGYDILLTKLMQLLIGL